MTSKFKAGTFSFFLVLIIAPVMAPANPIPTETGSYCLDQALNFLRNRFSADAEITGHSTIVWGAPPGGTVFDYILKTNLCEGEVTITFATPPVMCTTPHMDSVPRYASQADAAGDCRRIMPWRSPVTDADVAPVKR